MSVLIFDFDGTIANTLPLMAEVLNSLSEEFHFQRLNSDELKGMRDSGHNDWLLRLGIPWRRVPSLVSRVRSEMRRAMPTVAPFPGIKESLESLRSQKRQLGILTSNAKPNVELFLRHQGIDVFDFIYSGVSFFGKAAMLKRLLKSRKIETEQAIYVGDEVRDIEAARSLGIRIASVGWGLHSLTRLSALSPDFLLTHPGELAALK